LAVELTCRAEAANEVSDWRRLMDEHALRQLVRQAVARHLGAPTAEAQPAHQPINPPAHQPGHASHALYQGLVNVTDACVIEPAVPCDHCGYCKSHGH